jgi:hypothetical protein
VIKFQVKSLFSNDVDGDQTMAKDKRTHDLRLISNRFADTICRLDIVSNDAININDYDGLFAPIIFKMMLKLYWVERLGDTERKSIES